MKKIKFCVLAIVLGLVSAFGGCKNLLPSDDDPNRTGNETTVYVANFGGGVGDTWLHNAADRFAEEKKDEEYETGKQGVYIDIYSATNVGTANMASEGYNIYFTENSGNAKTLANAGVLLDISDVVTDKVYDNGTASIESKIDGAYLSNLKGADGKYYALPHYELFPGVTYNAELFEKENLYIAAPDADDRITYESSFGTVDFVKSATGKRSCGLDGKYGTSDDGLPTSLTELVVLCDYMDYNGIVPFTVTGYHIDYYNYLTEALMMSLAGYEASRAMFSLDGNAEVVTGTSSEPLFQTEDFTIYKPETKTEKITEQNGYLTREFASRYYAIAFTELLVKMDWMSKDSNTRTVTHLDAQYNFIFGGVNNKPKVGFIIEGSQWYNESVTAGNFSDYEKYTGKKSQLAWMPMPVSVDAPITENNGVENTVLDFGSSYVFVNSKTANNAGVLRAVKDFLKFLYSEEELKAFTATTGVTKAGVNYDYKAADVTDNLSDFQKSILDLKSNGNIVYQCSDSKVYANHAGDFRMAIDALMFQGTYGGTVKRVSYLNAVRDGNYATQKIFDEFKISPTAWANTYYEG